MSMRRERSEPDFPMDPEALERHVVLLAAEGFGMDEICRRLGMGREEVRLAWLAASQRLDLGGFVEPSQNDAGFDQIVSRLPDIVYVYNIHDKAFAFVNRSMGSLLGYSTSEIVQGGNPMEALVHPEDSEGMNVHLSILPFLQDGEVSEFSYRMKHKEGRWVWLHSREVSYAKDDSGMTSQVLGTASDATLYMMQREKLQELVEKTSQLNTALEENQSILRLANQRLEQLAASDNLTGLSNYRRFIEQLDIECRRAERSGDPLSLLMINLDQFKNFNELYGHPVGDAFLQSLGKALLNQTRPTDFCGRLGGDAFAVLLPMAHVASSLELGERIRNAIEALGAGPRRVAVSIGAASWAPGVSPEDLHKRAEHAMFAAKKAGGNRCTHYMTVRSVEAA
jgi:diguanylate cyclase (GGDEF)-like protein/PAS domain S-box-containing protein